MALKITEVDFLKQENAPLHHTAGYDHTSLIVRRGQEFTIKLICSRELRDNETMTLQFGVGEKPSLANESLVGIELKSASDSNRWKAVISKKSGNECFIRVKSPADAIVGRYCLSVITQDNKCYTPENNAFYILFNPWCADDTVFMPNESERWEYILNDTGYIYVGSENHISGRPWNYGQFEENVLDACMFLLDKKKLKASARKDPVIVSRAMSAMVNSNDDAGVLTGNWAGKYVNGTSPLSWTGSATILQKYYKTQKPVNYGQCWVFSGLLTTVMRCLGIPARSITNFASAHDTEENLKVDVYLNEKGEQLNDWTSDSVWNFHVWNDVWMKRPDLPSGFDGWQAIDATPQEQSQGIFQCGPSPLKAIKTGHVHLPHDSKFIFAEVNADRIYWLVKTEQGQEKVVLVKEEKSCIGKCISTKTVGMNTREDITCQYKFEEGSPEERNAMATACSYLKSEGCFSNATPLPFVSSPAIKVEILGDKTLWPGNPITLNIAINNSSTQAQTVNLIAICEMVTYTGKIMANLASITQTIEVGCQQATAVPLNIAADAYLKTMMSVEDELQIRVHAISETVGTEEKFSESTMILFEYPPIKVEMPETAKLNKDFTCTFTFKNTLKIPLESCKLHVEGLGLFKLETFDEGDLEPGKIFRSKIICAPTKTGEKKIVAKLNSKQAKGMSVEKMITIS
ncbi:protein-glutamine gamma-glutamyltransferase 4 [Microcaecilia unicolor]|uniref:protein-glutamine gamma-glutamyltransferase n=1 Tax=Microcaecilia unicolor TaxID=1415580 RepID=A0A6P7YPI4_9AMPH|nr:protein-glutamine gamma-glutamyltransferase 4 [Microcaecilia unicolor]